MALYDTSKQITKFTISGVFAVMFDFAVYYALSNIFKGSVAADVDLFMGFGWNDVFKGLGFISGTLVTYNLNKYWTWRQKDKNNKRLRNFFILYAFSFVANILINRYFLGVLPDNDIAIVLRNGSEILNELLALKVDKLFAFLIATVCSSIITFIGQKIWIFKVRNE